MTGATQNHTRPFMFLAAAMLVLGIAVDALFTQPRLHAVQRLRAELVTLQAQTASVAEQGRVAAALENYQSGLTGNDAPSISSGDPLTFVASVARRSGLVTKDLSLRDNSVENGVRKTRLDLRAQGDFKNILGFIRALEGSPRVSAIDALSIESREDTGSLDARLDLSVFDASGG